MKNFKLKFEQNWPKPLLITTKTYHDPDDPDSEKLPSVFDSLSPSEVSNYQSRRPLPKKIDQAAAILWYSSLQDIIQLMLVYFHKRPHTQNGLQHLIPSTAFAHSFVNSNSYLNLSEKQKHKTETIINSGKRPDGSFLFDHRDHTPPPLAQPPAPAPHAMGMMRGTTRQREFADDGGSMAASVKKQKQGN